MAKLKNNCSIESSNEEANNHQIVKAKIPYLFSEIVKKICEIIQQTPAEFIGQEITWRINEIMKQIEDGYYDFLGNYIDFSEITELISRIYKNKNL